MSGRVERIGGATLYLGDCLEILPTLPPADHLISDPPYEARLHAAKAGPAPRRTDGRAAIQGLDFGPVDAMRAELVRLAGRLSRGWAIFFCTVEGVAKWADAINPSPIKYKRACIWIKPDSTPQLNGQGPAQGAECFVAAWAGAGYARWNAGGKRGVYTHCVNGPERDGGHPTEKPLALMREIVADFTGAGETVLDPFMGTGATGIACAREGRRFVGIELEPRYFDIACRRLEEAERQADLFPPTPTPTPAKARQARMAL